MPKTKKNKVVHTSKTEKKNAEHKQILVQKLQQALEKYEFIFIFRYENMTTVPFKDLREKWTDSKFFLGKNKVMQIALGKDEDSSYLTNTYKLSEHLKGDCGILCTNKSKDEVIKFFNDFAEDQYAKAGTVSTQTIVLKPDGPEMKKFSHSIEPYLRQLGLTTTLYNGEIKLNADFILAENDKPLNVEQCKLLKLLDIKLGKFRVTPVCYWKKSTNSYFDIKKK